MTADIIPLADAQKQVIACARAWAVLQGLKSNRLVSPEDLAKLLQSVDAALLNAVEMLKDAEEPK